MTDQESCTVVFLDSALEKLPPFHGILYRNIGFDDFGGKDARDAFMADHVDGMPIGYSAYTSASKYIDGYQVNGQYVVHIVIPESAGGRDLNGIGNNFENEVIYPRDTVFFVDRVTYSSDGTPTIYLQEVMQSEQRGSHKEDRIFRQGKHGQLYPDERSMAVRKVPEANIPHNHLQGIPERDSKGNPDGTGTLQGEGSEVSEPAPLAATTAEEQTQQKDAIANKEHPNGILNSKDVTNDGVPHPERWTAKRVGSSDTAPKPVSDIIAQIRHDFGLNIWLWIT